MVEEEVVAHCSVSGLNDGDDGRGGEVVEAEEVRLRGYMGEVEAVVVEHMGEAVKVVEESNRDSSWLSQVVLLIRIYPWP